MYKKYEALLEERKTTSYFVAKETGIPQSTFSDWKNGISKPKVDKLMKIADLFQVPLEYFLKE